MSIARSSYLLGKITVLIVICFLVMGSFIVNTALCTAAYKIIDLGTLGGDDSAATCISNNCSIVGYSRTTRIGYKYATLFDASGSGNNKNLGVLSGCSWSTANYVNNTYQAVGVSEESGGSYDYHATLFDTTGNSQPKSLGTIGGPRGKAYSMNDKGKIVGFSYPGDPGSTNPHATLFDESGAGHNVDLGMIPGGRRSIAYSINDSNQIVGFVEMYGDDDNAVLFDETGGQNNISLGYGIAYSINNRGKVVGESSDRIATIFDITGGSNNVSLGALPVYDSSKANCISDSGQIVGEAYYWYDSYKFSRAVLFDTSGTGNNIDLNYLIDPTSDWELLEATGINEEGWIVGNGINSDGEYQAFLLIPEPPKYGGGSGEPNDPYQIRDANHMQAIGADSNDWDKHFKLMADIDLSGFTGTSFNIIGYFVDWFSPENKPFTGVFDGNGHTISNFTHTSTYTDCIGLFGYVKYGEIKNLGLIDPNVDAGTGQRIGSLVGMVFNGIVTGCYVERCSITGDYDVGGLVGENVGTISNCYSTGSVSGYYDVGGLVGSNIGNNGTILNCYSTGDVSGDYCVGGLVGRNSVGKITNCYSTASVSGTGGLVGGLVGENGFDSTITNCYSTGSVSGTGGDVGGLVGYSSSYGHVVTSYWDIETSGQDWSDGGIGLPTSQMQTRSTFADYGWDFVNVWGIGENQTYPYLRRYLAGDINKDGIVNFKDFAIVALQWLEEYNVGNRAPEVMITYPEDGARLMVGGVPPQTLIMAEAEDSDGTVVRVEFFDGEMKLGEDTDGSDGWNYLWTGYSLGWHTLTAVAWDNEGLPGTSAPVTVEVWMPDPPPP